MKKVYLAGKITGDPHYTEKFRRAAARLEAGGAYIVMSPAVLPDGFAWLEYMHISSAMMDICESVCFLPDWRESKGAMYEYGKAKALGLPIFMYEDFENEQETCQGLANGLPETCEPLAEPVPEKKKRALSHKTCVDCGGKFESGPRGRRCPECRKKHQAQEPERRKAQRAKQRNQAPGQPAPEPEPEPPKLGDKDYGARQLARSGWLLAEYGTCDLAKIRKIEEEREKNAEDCQRTP
jgi:hypothetical protein